MDTIFEDIIGQGQAKKQLSFFLKSYLSTRIFPNMMFNAAKGQGKSTLAKATARGLVKFDDDGSIEMKEDKVTPKKKQFLEINCSSLKNVGQFINAIVVPLIQDKDITVLFDEASEIPKDISMALLTILNPNPESKTTYCHDDYVCEFDFRKQTFLFATSEPQQIFHALLDRLTRIDLEDYTPDQMAQIVQKGAKEVTFKEDVLKDIATVLRGNARSGQKMADNIKAYLEKRTTFVRKDWTKMCDIFNILPLGVNNMELRILQLLAASPTGIPLTGLSAKTGLSREALQRDYELYITRLGLMTIGTGGREITANGLEYLRELKGRAEPVSIKSKKVI